MAPGRPRITIGIQPNTAMFSLVAGSVCAFGKYFLLFFGLLCDRIRMLLFEFVNINVLFLVLK